LRLKNDGTPWGKSGPKPKNLTLVLEENVEVSEAVTTQQESNVPSAEKVVDVEPVSNPRSTYAVTLHEHGKDKEVNKLVFVGLFSECMAFVTTLDQIKPGQQVGSLTMERVTAPYRATVARQDGNGASFKFTSRSGVRTAELVLP
jgi:hypothetical protein